MKQITTILFLTFICHFNPLFSQTKTPYEKKKEEIAIKYLKKMGVSVSEINRAKSADESGLILLLLLGEKIQQYEYSHGMEALVLMSEWKKELKAAENLKNSQDFEKERLQREENENKAKAKQLEYDEKIRIENQKNDELRRMNSDLGVISEEIKTEFETWLVKGEFEKTEEYRKRLEFKELKFIEICDKAVLEQLSTKVAFQKVDWIPGTKSIMDKSESFVMNSYNSDDECFSFYFRFKEIDFFDTIYVGFNDAIEFKNQTDYSSISLPQKRQEYLFYDYYLYPSKIMFKNVNNKTPIEVQLNFIGLPQQIQFTTSDLNLTNYNFEELQYDFNDFKKRKSEILLTTAQQMEEKEDLETALSLYSKLLEFDKNSAIAKSKIESITQTLSERKRKVLIEKAQELFDNGKLSECNKLYVEANSIRKSSEIDEKIKNIENTITASKKKNDELKKQIGIILINNSFIKQTKLFDDLENMKRGYGDKYNMCVDTLNFLLRTKKSAIDIQYKEFQVNQNIEIWTENNQKLLDLTNSFILDYERYKLFETNIFSAIQNENKKYLKILKEDEIRSIIEMVIKTN